MLYLHSRRSRTTRVSVRAGRTLKTDTDTHVIKEEWRVRRRWSPGSMSRPPFRLQRRGVGLVLHVRYLQLYAHIVPFPLPVLWDRSALPRGPSVFVYRCSVSPVCCLPVQVMTYGCDFPHPYTFPLVFLGSHKVKATHPSPPHPHLHSLQSLCGTN